jgi:hypothetical protein
MVANWAGLPSVSDAYRTQFVQNPYELLVLSIRCAKRCG